MLACTMADGRRDPSEATPARADRAVQPSLNGPASQYIGTPAHDDGTWREPGPGDEQVTCRGRFGGPCVGRCTSANWRRRIRPGMSRRRMKQARTRPGRRIGRQRSARHGPSGLVRQVAAHLLNGKAEGIPGCGRSVTVRVNQTRRKRQIAMAVSLVFALWMRKYPTEMDHVTAAIPLTVVASLAQRLTDRRSPR